MRGEYFEIDVGELSGGASQWRAVPRVMHSRQEMRRVLNNLVELMLDETAVHVDVIYLRVRRMEQGIAASNEGNPDY